MKKLLVLFIPALLALYAPAASGQARTVTGLVTAAETGQPLPGISVRVQGTSLGTLTNAQGRYSISVPAGGRTLSFSSLAYATQEVEIVGDVVNVALVSEAVALEGILVTALGIERQSRSLGVAAQQVSGEELNRAETNIVNTLQGKVAGVSITNAGVQGGSSRLVIRGNSSLTGNNQPLWVIDGVPIDNYSGFVRNTGYGSIDYGNAVQDIAPENIESITVLKGANAAALYGSRASGGAVIVTMKSGRNARGGLITASQQVTWEDPLRLPDWQDQFGQGVDGQFRYVDGNGGGVYDEVDESWGPPLDGRLIEQYNSPIVNGVRQATPWVARPDNINQFFETGRTLQTNASFAAASDEANVRLSMSRMNQDGMMPGFSLGRTTAGLNGGVTLSERLTATGSAQYVGSDGAGRPGIGYGETNPMIQFIWFGRQVDMQDLRANYNTFRGPDDVQAGMPYSWNYSYHPNPYFLQQVNGNRDKRDRLIGNVGLNYQFTPWLSALVRTGTDWYQDDRRTMYAEGNYGVTNVSPITGGDEIVGDRGAFGQYQIGFQETNTDFLLSLNRNLSDAVTLNANLGGNRRDFRRQTNYVWVAGLSAPGIFSVENASETPDPFDFLSRKRVNSLYGQTEFGLNNYLFVTLTGRNDWSSTLPEGNNSYFYPSVSGSLILSDMIPALGDGPLGYAKLRASWARVGSDADPYQLSTTYLSNPAFDGFPRFEVANSIKNAELRPESTDSWEVGTELGFVDNRLSLDLTYYNEVTRDQILPVQISRASGFSSTVVNAGSVRNRGIEMAITATPLRTPDFHWESTVTWAKNSNEVVELAEGLESLTLGNFWYGSIQARPGEPYGSIVGTTYRRDSQDRIVVNSSGVPIRNVTQSVLGNYNPDWTGGWANSFSFKGLNLNVLLDTKQGGDIYSVSNQWGTYAGVFEETVRGRCIPDGGDPVEGMPACSPETGILVPNSVRVTAAGDTVPNTGEGAIYTNSQAYWNSSGVFAVTETNVFDASFVKLREVTLTYQVPVSLTDRLRVSGLQLGLTGRNLALWTDTPHIDPETAFDASNVQGLEFGQIPAARSVGLNISIQP
jgi:TonB-linked SusC/RagA family outer membrane protein